jgi:Mrp family chromosome partitioning ATPase
MDYVIVDVPPTGVVVDSSEIAKSCDGILLVVDYDNVHGKEFAEIKAQLEQTGCPILGAVLNQVKMNAFMSRRYYFKTKYGYYSDFHEK